MKVAVITGSARGIGRETALLFTKAGYHTIFSDIADRIDLDFENTEYIKCDISKSEDRQSLFDQIRKKHGRLDVLVNNAGIAPAVRGDLLDMREESLQRVMSVNLTGTFFMCQLGAKLLAETAAATAANTYLINTSSISSYTSSTSRGEYCISKAGVEMITTLFADRLAEEGVRVFAVRPGIILTDMTKVVEEKYNRLIAEGITPIRRFGQPIDVGKTIVALCSGAFDFCTGQMINADGGFHIKRL